MNENNSIQETPPGTGWKTLTRSSEPLAGIFNLEAGAVFHGIYEENFAFGAKRPGDVMYCFKALAKMKITSKEHGEIFVEPGTRVGVSEFARLKPVRELPAGTEVWFRVKGKNKLENGNTPWDVEVHAKVDGAPKSSDTLNLPF